MDRDLTDFKLDGLDENQNIGQLLGLTKVYKLRFYLKTKTKMVKKADVDETCHTDDLPDLTVKHPNTVHPNKIGTLVGPAEEKPQELVVIPDGNEATVKVSQVSTFESIEDLTIQHHDVVHPKIIGTSDGPVEEKPLELVVNPDCNEATFNVSEVSTFETIAEEAWVDSLGEVVIPGFIPLRATPKDIDIIVHRGHAFSDLTTYFKTCVDVNPKIDNITTTVILPNGDAERADDFGGVMRDVITEFWEQFYESCTVGYNLKIPILRHDFQQDDWAAVARVIAIGWTLQKMLPVRLAPSFLNCCLYGMDLNKINSDSMLDEYLQFISAIEQEMVKQALNDFNSVEYDDLLDFLGNRECKVLVTSSNFRETILQMASKEMHQEPAFIKETLFNVLLSYNLEIDVAREHEQLKVTTKRVLSIVECEDTSQRTCKFFLKYIRELSTEQLRTLMRFTTATDMMLSDSNNCYLKLKVNLVDMHGFGRRPVAHTCGRVLELAKNYESFPQFRAEFNAVLSSKVWVMDIC